MGEQLVEYEPAPFVERFCVSLEDVEDAFLYMQMSLMFFGLTLLMGCVYCCLIRVATKDISILTPGNQWDVSSPTLNPTRAIDRGVVRPLRGLGQQVMDNVLYSEEQRD